MVRYIHALVALALCRGVQSDDLEELLHHHVDPKSMQCPENKHVYQDNGSGRDYTKVTGVELINPADVVPVKDPFECGDLCDKELCPAFGYYYRTDYRDVAGCVIAKGLKKTGSGIQSFDQINSERTFGIYIPDEEKSEETCPNANAVSTHYDQVTSCLMGDALPTIPADHVATEEHSSSSSHSPVSSSSSPSLPSSSAESGASTSTAPTTSKNNEESTTGTDNLRAESTVHSTMPVSVPTSPSTTTKDETPTSEVTLAETKPTTRTVGTEESTTHSGCIAFPFDATECITGSKRSTCVSPIFIKSQMKCFNEDIFLFAMPLKVPIHTATCDAETGWKFVGLNSLEIKEGITSLGCPE